MLQTVKQFNTLYVACTFNTLLETQITLLNTQNIMKTRLAKLY